MEIRKGTQNDAEKFIELLQIVRSKMEHKDWLYLDPAEDVREMISDGMLEFWIALDESRLAGAFSVIYPGFTEMNYGYDLDFSKEQLLCVVCMDTIAVLPEYRGQGLQYRLMQAAEHAVGQTGGKILLCTVHPDNRFSLENILKQGYTIERKLEKYKSVRYILRKDTVRSAE